MDPCGTPHEISCLVDIVPLINKLKPIF